MANEQNTAASVCPHCGQLSEAGARFCQNCAAGLSPTAAGATVCPKCGTPVGPTVRFCGNCGARWGRTPGRYYLRVGVPLLAIVIGSALLLCLRFRPGSPAGEIAVSFDEKLLVTIPQDLSMPEGGWVPVFSKNGRQVAYTAQRGRKQLVVVGSERGPEFDGVHGVALSGDGRKAAYVVKQVQPLGGKCFVVVDGEKGPEFEFIDWVYLTPGAARVAYSVLQKDRWLLVIDGRLSLESEKFLALAFSRDERRVAYTVRQANKGFIVLDGKRGPEFEEVGSLTFSFDGTSLAYAARQNRKWFVVMGDRRGPEFDGIGTLRFSPDGGKIAYVGHVSGKQFLMIGDQKGPEFDQITFVDFSSDGAKVAYLAQQGGKWFIVSGSIIVPPEGAAVSLAPPVLSPDGKIVAYAATVGDYSQIHRPGTGQKWFVVAGNKKGPVFDYVSPPQFSLDGSKIAYGAQKDRELWWKVMDVR